MKTSIQRAVIGYAVLLAGSGTDVDSYSGGLSTTTPVPITAVPDAMSVESAVHDCIAGYSYSSNPSSEGGYDAVRDSDGSASNVPCAYGLDAENRVAELYLYTLQRHDTEIGRLRGGLRPHWLEPIGSRARNPG
jgi:hypothetical protein